MENINRAERLSLLRQKLTTFEKRDTDNCLKNQTPDALSRIFKQGAVHELYASTAADAVAVNAFALMAGAMSSNGRRLVWAVHSMMISEFGDPYGGGIEEIGIETSEILFAKAPNIKSLLIIGEESLKTSSVGSVVISAWGDSKDLSLTASRRLALAAKSEGATLFFMRAGAEPTPSAAETRWSVKATASVPLAGGAPGHPSFSLTLLRHRGGGEAKNWVLEWDRDARLFREPAPLPRAVVPMAAQRPAEARGESPRRVA
ncbi:protein ImuA [Brevundimonas vesicularis]|uniref:Protein ImuA n=1 Tax=Brevundimonas vesicularis TaxID=41276 RepID=A0A7W9FSB3_BREVE|nr:hypothetical protein [Brevundimonas vesicularis]MBB5770617.1 protein ImuA [Brevundimonas vesicularis]